MGCDVHPYILFNDRFYAEGEDAWTHAWKLYGSRNYTMFGLMTGGEVRNSDVPSVAPKPRGLPDRSLGWVVEADLLHFITTATDNPGSGESDYVEPDDAADDAAKWVREYGSLWVNFHWGRGIETSDDPVCPAGWHYVTDPDYHDTSWLTLDEFQVVCDTYIKLDDRYSDEPEPEWQAALAAMRVLHVQNLNPILLFTFDS